MSEETSQALDSESIPKGHSSRRENPTVLPLKGNDSEVIAARGMTVRTLFKVEHLLVSKCPNE